MENTRYFCPILTRLELSRQILDKYSDTEFLMKIRPVGAVLFHADGHIDR